MISWSLPRGFDPFIPIFVADQNNQIGFKIHFTDSKQIELQLFISLKSGLFA